MTIVTTDEESDVDNLDVYLAIDRALRELGLEVNGSQSSAEGVSTDYFIDNYQVTIIIKSKSS